MEYQIRLDFRGSSHRVWKTWPPAKNAKPGYRYPAVRQTYSKPGGPKIQRRYYQEDLKDLYGLQFSWLGFLALLRRGAVLFNKVNKKHVILGFIKYPLGKGEFVIGENVLCDLNTATVTAERSAMVKDEDGKKVRKKFLRIKPTIARLTEVVKGSEKPAWGGLRWRVLPGSKGEIWIEADDTTRL